MGLFLQTVHVRTSENKLLKVSSLECRRETKWNFTRQVVFKVLLQPSLSRMKLDNTLNHMVATKVIGQHELYAR